jgi:hypothetical protein
MRTGKVRRTTTRVRTGERKKEDLMKVYIKNTEPAWVQYGLSVEIDGAMATSVSDDDIRRYALDKCYEGEYEVESGPDVKTQIEGMDQEFEVTQVQP